MKDMKISEHRLIEIRAEFEKTSPKKPAKRQKLSQPTFKKPKIFIRVPGKGKEKDEANEGEDEVNKGEDKVSEGGDKFNGEDGKVNGEDGEVNGEVSMAREPQAQASASDRIDSKAGWAEVVPTPTAIQNGVHKVQTAEPAKAGRVRGETGESIEVIELFSEDEAVSSGVGDVASARINTTPYLDEDEGSGPGGVYGRVSGSPCE
jgi:hypothetical protein